MQIAGTHLLTRLFAVPLLFGGAESSPQTTQPEALEAALEWLILLDNEDYAGTWETAADLFQTAITRDNWIARITSVKAPLGKLIAREFRSSEPVMNPAGVPEGEYLVIRFATSFEDLERAMETIVLHHTPAGDWKVSGYFIRPVR
jgi:hypothetical protein